MVPHKLHIFLNLLITVRDSERGISSMCAMGWGSGQIEKLSARRRRRRRHSEIKVDIQTRKLYLDVFLRFWTPGERSREMETGVLLRISLRVS